MKYRDSEGNLQEIYLPPTGDTLPIGSVVDYDGDTVPANWELVEDMNMVTDGEPIKAGYKVDGKDVYVKRINYGSLPNATNTIIATGLSNITVVKLEGIGIRSSDNLTIAIPYAAPDYLVAAMYVSSSNSIRIVSQADMSAYVGYMSIYFTYNEEVTTNED